MGFFYPTSIKQSEMLGYYSRRFPVVEVNSSYYGVPKPERMARMVEDTSSEFRFVLKTHQDMTHNKGVRAGAEAEAFPAFRDALKPLIASGKLEALPAQFPWSFPKTAGERALPLPLARRAPRLPGGYRAAELRVGG